MARITEDDVCKHAKIQSIAADVRLIKEEIVEKIPAHFSVKHIVSAFMGALLMGLTFVFKGLLLQVAAVLNRSHMLAIIVSTIVLLTAEIYFVGYQRVKNKEKRPFFQFWFKRVITYYAIAMLVAFLVVYIYGVNIIAGANTMKVVIAVALPCAVGASLADLLKKY
jgi:uncharacterized membrane protein